MSSLTERESAEFKDNILELFRGRKTILKTDLWEKYKSHQTFYFETENHVSELLAEELLVRVGNEGDKDESFRLSDKGVHVISNMKLYGCLAKYDKSESQRKSARLMNRIHLGIQIAVLIVAAITLYYTC